MDKADIQSLKSILLNNGAEFVGIFGSRSRGDNNQDSDLDILVRFKKGDKSLIDVIRIQNELSDTLGMKVDLLTENSVSKYIKKYILKDLKVVVDSN